MSFRTTREICEQLRDSYLGARQWCSRLSVHRDNESLHWAADAVGKELTARLKSFQAVIQDTDPKALNTYLQYEPTELVLAALGDLTAKTPHDADTLLQAVSDFYEIIFDGLRECEISGDPVSVQRLFEEMEREAKAGITSLAWKLREED